MKTEGAFSDGAWNHHKQKGAEEQRNIETETLELREQDRGS